MDVRWWPLSLEHGVDEIILATIFAVGMLVMSARTWADASLRFEAELPTSPRHDSGTGASLGADLDGLLQWAKDHGPEYASAQQDWQAALERTQTADALPDPKLRTEWMDVTRGGTQAPALWPVDVGSTRYTLMQDIPWFGKRSIQKNIALQEADASRSRALGVWAELAARIKRSQAQRYFLHHSRSILQEQLDWTDRLLQVTQARYAGGLIPQQDVIRVQVEQTALQTDLLAVTAELRQADARLNAMLARPHGASLAAPDHLRVVPDARQLDADAWMERIRLVNPDVLAETARAQSAVLSRDLTFKNRYPDVTLAVSPTQVQGAITEWALMLELNIPLRQEVRRSQEREADARLLAAQSRRDALALQVQADLSDSLTGLDAAQATGHLTATSLLPQARLNLQAAWVGYENGKIDFATLLEALRQVQKAQQSLLKAQTDARMRLAEIEKLAGDLP